MDGIVKAGIAAISGLAMNAKDEKAERLAAALRENLRKRKAQARGAADAAQPPDDKP